MGKRKRDRRDDSGSISEQEVHDKVKFLKNRADLCQRLHDAVKRIRGKSGHPKCEFLSRLPSRRSNPDYYKVIAEPISLVDIEQKLKTGQYNNVSSFVDDMELMFNNAKTYYEAGSQENRDAELLQAEFTTELRCILKEEDETCSPETKKLKLRISHGKVVSNIDEDCSGEVGSSDVAKNERQQQSSEDAGEELVKGEGLIVQIKLQDTSTLSIRDDSCKPKREKQRKDYAELFGQRKKLSEEEKEKMLEIYDVILNEKDEDDLLMYEPFMVRPSVKKYPHYYIVVKRPIDLQEIKEKIDNDKYVSIERFMVDIHTLFRNAKFFNEESSTIYEYADHLHKIAKAKYQQLTNPASLCPPATSSTPSPAPPTSEPAAVVKDTPINPNVGAIFDEVKTYTSPDGRALWETFKSLPNKLTNSDYYTVIKQPIDMITIATKLLAREYPDVEKIFNDFVLLFDNTCHYYQPYTDQYKDAVMLHEVLVEKREQLIQSRPPNPNVPKLVQNMFRNLIKTVMQYKDPVSGRRLSDNIWANPSPEHKEECHDNDDDSVVSTTDLITVEKRTIKGLYCRLDLLQEDVMSLLKHVQSMSTPDNQVYQDALKLQQVFLQERDRLCHNGKLLWSPAFSQYSLEQLKQQQAEEAGTLIASAALEVADNEHNVDSDDGLTEDCREYLETTDFSGSSYSVGDTVYINSKKGGSYLPHIVAIEKLWADKNNGDHWFSGSWFYRPEETFHVSTRRFIVNEVFCTNRHQMVRLSRVAGKCCVLQYKDYCRNTIEGFDDEHTFVCRDRYHIQMKSFKPLKNWGVIGKHWVLVPRQQPMKLDYVYSKFASSELIAKLEGRRGNQPETPVTTEGVDISEPKDNEGNDMDEIASSSLIELEEFHLEYDNVLSKDQTGVDAGCLSYDQYCLDQYCFRLGDYVYLRSDEQQSFIARIEKMWTDQNGDPWFHGCWFLRPSETMHLPTHTFYPNELLMSNIADTNPMRSVIGKCAVLTFKDFCTWRPTEIDEKDVYLCEERYNEHDKDFKKLKGLKKFLLSSDVVVDEIYYFQKEIIPYKEASPHLFSLPSETVTEIANEVSDPVVESAPSVNMESSNYDVNDQEPSVGVQPIILFALDLQSQLRSRGSEMTLATVIQAARNEWPKLSTEQQAEYQLRSSELSSLLPSSAVVPGNTNQPVNKPPSVAAIATPTYTRSSYVCYWDGCGLQFADVAGLFAHVTDLGAGTHIKKEGVSNYYCEWRNCHRHKRCGGKPFNTQAKMLRHLKEVHMGRAIKEKMSYSGSTPQWQSKDFNSTPATPTEPVAAAVHPKPSTVLPAVPLVSASMATLSMGTNPATTADTVTTNSINTVPSINAHQEQQKNTATTVGGSKQASQLLHTTVYTRYIEGLRQNRQHSSNWSDSLSIRQQGMTRIEPGLHVDTWLSPKTSLNNKNLVDALYQLRDYLLQDAAKLSKYLSTT